MWKTKRIVETTQSVASADSSVRRLGRPLPTVVYASNAMLMATRIGPTRNKYRKNAVSTWQTAIDKKTTTPRKAANDDSCQSKCASVDFSTILVVSCWTPRSSHFGVVAVALNPE